MRSLFDSAPRRFFEVGLTDIIMAIGIGVIAAIALFVAIFYFFPTQVLLGVCAGIVAAVGAFWGMMRLAMNP